MVLIETGGFSDLQPASHATIARITSNSRRIDELTGKDRFCLFEYLRDN